MSVKSRVLTEDQIDAIAAEARTKPLSEIGRHVMPLIQHIIGVYMRYCRDCTWWDPIGGGRQEAGWGNCTHPAFCVVSDNPPVGHTPVRTRVDWYCRGWEELREDSSDAEGPGSIHGQYDESGIIPG